MPAVTKTIETTSAIFVPASDGPTAWIAWMRDASSKRLVVPVRPKDRKSTRLNSSHGSISYAVFCLKKKFKKPGSYPLKHNHHVLAHVDPIRTATGELDLNRRWKQDVALSTNPFYNALFFFF